jgi:small subunit ribosomal protein S19e
MKMAVYDIPAAEYNDNLALALKEMEEFKMPEWAAFVKTSVARERPPKEEFWHKRAASILRQLYIHGIVGVGRLRTRYGGRKNRGQKPERFRKGSGKIIRVILQQAEAVGFVEKARGKKAGRQLTTKGREFLDSIKTESKLEIKKEVPEIKPEIVEEKPVEQIVEKKEEAEEMLDEVEKEIKEEIKEEKIKQEEIKEGVKNAD